MFQELSESYFKIAIYHIEELISSDFCIVRVFYYLCSINLIQEYGKELRRSEGGMA